MQHNIEYYFSVWFEQLPLPPGLSIYSDVDETTSNIYESIDLQRKYIFYALKEY